MWIDFTVYVAKRAVRLSTFCICCCCCIFSGGIASSKDFLFLDCNNEIMSKVTEIGLEEAFDTLSTEARGKNSSESRSKQFSAEDILFIAWNQKAFESTRYYLLFLFLELYLGSRIPELLEVPSALDFARDYVGKNMPVVIRGCTLHWPAVLKWNSKYFR